MKEIWGTMKINETLLLGEDFYSLSFFGYYIQPEELIIESIETNDLAKSVIGSLVSKSVAINE